MILEAQRQMPKKNLKAILAASVMIGSILVVGCASQPTVKNSRVFYVPEFYTVQPGDSLSKIAAKYGLNYMEVAQLNNIDSIDKIYVNQSLRLRSGDKSSQRLVARTAPLEQNQGIQSQSLALPTAQQNANNTVPRNVQPVKPVQPQVVVPTVVTPIAAGQLKWVLPSKGPIVARFSPDQDRKGLFFGGKAGDAVFAATSGEVVYADDGLKEYGQLILLRHGNGYVTAYAHNQKLLVKVGDKVNSGQKIAEMGSTGTSTTMLQFQIRLDGKPIDPITVLPIS